MNEKSNQPKMNLSATIKSLSHDGRGIANVNNKTIFINGALPNEVVNYQITKKHARYDEAILTHILESTQERVTPPCQHFGICGGCNLQHLSNNLQISLKQQTLLEQLKHFGQVEPDHVLPPLTTPSTIGYRRKARLGVKFVIKKNKVLVGFREKSSRYLADLTECKTLHPAIGLKLNELSDLVASLSIKQDIPQIEVAIGDEDIALIIRHMVAFNDLDLEKLKAFGKSTKIELYLQPNSPLPLQKLYPNDNFHRLNYSLPNYQVNFLFHPLDFTQINLDLNRLMVDQAIQLLQLNDKDKVLDLFCGIGNFTLPMARLAKQVTGIEGSDEMVLRAQENALHNHIQNVTFFSADLFSPKENASWLQESYDKILLDPPRTGAKEIIPYLAQCAAKKILYVSCNPATLARDAGELIKYHDYRLTHAGIMNMFPHTAHTEAMALFEKN